LVDDLRAKDIDHVYLITSDFHMPRSKDVKTDGEKPGEGYKRVLLK
jgi:hypothetical protein